MKKIIILDVFSFVVLLMSCDTDDKIINNEALKAEVTTIRDDFIAKLNSLQFDTPNIPKVLIKNTPALISFGSEGITIPDWDVIENDRKDMFNSWATQANGSFTGEQFLKGLSTGFVVHELGHYVQSVNGTENNSSQYQVELNANEIAVAYFKEQDPQRLEAYIVWLNKILQVIPTPASTSEDYYNTNVEAQTDNDNFNGYFQYFFVQQAYLNINNLNLSDLL